MQNYMDVPVSGALIDEKDKLKMMEAVMKGWFTEGEYCKEFSGKLKKYIGTRHCSLVNSGSSANLVAVSAIKDFYTIDKDHNKVVTCATGFPTTVGAIVQAGLVPYFVDVNPKALNPDTNIMLEALSREDVVGIIQAHTLGFPFDAKAIREYCDAHGKFFVEDCCLAEGTKVKTLYGHKNIEDIEIGDFVLTRKGYKRVWNVKNTGIKPVIQRFGITATPDHPFITKHGTKRFDALKTSDIIYIWNEKRSLIEEKRIIDTQMPNRGNEGFIFGGTQKLLRSLCIGKYGLTTLVKSLMDFMFIIKMKIRLTMIHQTLNLLLQKNIPRNILQKNEESDLLKFLTQLPEKKHQNGIGVMRDESFTGLLVRNLGKINQHIQTSVKFVKGNIKHIFQKGQKTVLGNAKIKVATVYNLSVDGRHEFFANNILVHNCDALGAEIYGKKVGTFGHASTFSFFPAHHITTGEGGAILTDNGRLYSQINIYRDWGRACYCLPGQSNTCNKRFEWEWDNLPEGYDHKYTFIKFGYNLKFDEIRAALGSSQIDKIGEFVYWRRKHYAVLYEELNSLYCEFLGFINPYESFIDKIQMFSPVSPFGFPIAVTTDKFTRKELVDYLETHGVKTRPVFAGNITRQPMFDDVEYYKHSDLSGSDYVMERTFWVGCHPALKQEQLDHVVAVFDSFFEMKGLK